MLWQSPSKPGRTFHTTRLAFGERKGSRSIPITTLFGIKKSSGDLLRAVLFCKAPICLRFFRWLHLCPRMCYSITRVSTLQGTHSTAYGHAWIGVWFKTKIWAAYWRDHNHSDMELLWFFHPVFRSQILVRIGGEWSLSKHDVGWFELTLRETETMQL